MEGRFLETYRLYTGSQLAVDQQSERHKEKKVVEALTFVGKF
jgi:hypothetical protein